MIRLKPEIMNRVKYSARSRGLSVNAYIEEVLDGASRPAPIPKLPDSFEVSPSVKSLMGIIPPFTQEQLDQDPKLAYIIGKGA